MLFLLKSSFLGWLKDGLAAVGQNGLTNYPDSIRYLYDHFLTGVGVLASSKAGNATNFALCTPVFGIRDLQLDRQPELAR